MLEAVRVAAGPVAVLAEVKVFALAAVEPHIEYGLFSAIVALVIDEAVVYTLWNVLSVAPFPS